MRKQTTHTQTRLQIKTGYKGTRNNETRTEAQQRNICHKGYEVIEVCHQSPRQDKSSVILDGYHHVLLVVRGFVLLAVAANEHARH